jgi:hypothetical protein
MDNNFKYTATFGAKISLASKIDDNNLRISQSSLNGLKPLLPKHVDLEKNIDLMGVAFDGAVINTFNKNGDGIDLETASKIKDYFINKPVNIEHQRQKIVGHIVGSFFTRREDNSLIDTGDSLAVQTYVQEKSPFNLSLSAVIYRIVNPDFIELLESSSEESDGNPLYKSVSASWELGYNEYAIAVGSSNMLKDCEVVYADKDPELFESLSFHLSGEGGSGETEDGKKVFRLIVGEVFPLGIGLTMNPAADVSGVAVYNEEDNPTLEKESESKKINKNEEKISQNEKLTVINQNKPHNNIMENKEQMTSILEDLLGEKLQNKKFSDEAIATVTKVVNDAILEKNEQFLADKEEAEKNSQVLAEAKKETEEKLSAVNEEFESLKAQFEDTKKELDEIRAEQNAAIAAAIFDSRMEVLDSTYQLEDSDRELLASELKDLDSSDEAFTGYSEKISKIWSHKNKENIAEEAKLVEAKINEEVEKRLAELQATSEEAEKKTPQEEAVASVEEVKAEEAKVEEVTEEILENVVEASGEEIVNNNEQSSQSELSLKEKFEKAFSKENLTIKY